MSHVLGLWALGSLPLEQQAAQKEDVEGEGLRLWRVDFLKGVRWEREPMISSFFLVSAAQVPPLKSGKRLRR